MSIDKSIQMDANDLRETSLSYILKLAAPMIITNISFTLMQFVDRYMVSRLGTDALAAVLPAGLISFLPASFGIGITTSINTFVSQSFGKKQYADCSSYCWQGIYMGIFYIAAVVLIVSPLAPGIFKLMGHTPEIIAMEVVYLRIMLYAQFAAVFIWCTSQFFMGIHRPVITMYASLVGQVVNAGANYVLIFGKLGFPAMGIAGAGWGTFIGMCVGAGIRTAFYMNGEINNKFSSRNTCRLDITKMKQLFKVGAPAGVSLMLDVAVWGLVLLWLVGLFGKGPLAATSAVFACMNISVMPVVGISTTLTAIVGKSIGKNRFDLADKQTSLCLKIGMLYMGLAGLCFFLFRDPLMHFWTSDESVLTAGVNILVFAAIFQVFDAATIIYSGALRGAGDTMYLAAITAFGSLFILAGGGMLLIWLWPQGTYLGPWIAATANIIFVGVAYRLRFKSNRWKDIDIFKRKPVTIAVDLDAVVE